MDVNHLPEVSDLSKKSWGGIEGDREFFVWDVRRSFFFCLSCISPHVNQEKPKSGKGAEDMQSVPLVKGVSGCLPIWSVGASVVDVGMDEVEEGRKPLLRYAFTTAPCACIDISWLNHCKYVF